MRGDLVTRLRTAASSRASGSLEMCEMCDEAADMIELLTRELKAAIDQREHLIDAMKQAQAELRALQDMVITPKDDGL